MIRAINAGLTYPDGTCALKPFDLEVYADDMVYVTGPSGSGKTSLFKLLLGMEYATTGSVEVLGQPMIKSNISGIIGIRRSIGPVFQQFRLAKGRTALENVMSGLRFLDISGVSLRERALESINRVGMGGKAETRVDKLSWGECQRVAIARAIAREPRLLIADEPTGNLDHDNAVAILQLLASFKSEHTSVIVITHAVHLLENDLTGLFISLNAGHMKVERKV